MSRQEDCYRRTRYSSDPSGDRVGHLVGVPEAVLKQSSFRRNGKQRNRSREWPHYTDCLRLSPCLKAPNTAKTPDDCLIREHRGEF